MADEFKVTRRAFMGGAAAALGYVGLGGEVEAIAQTGGASAAARAGMTPETYETLVKLSFNENNYGPPEAVMKAMMQGLRYSNRYGYPDQNLVKVIADHHGVQPEHVLLGAGSGEILDVVGTTFLRNGKRVVGVEPSFGQVYEHATNIKTNPILVQLTKDYRQDIGVILNTVKAHAGEVGFVYLCNPNNPTGQIVTKQEVKQLLDGLPEGLPVLIDEAYHHFVESSDYATSVPYVIEGRPVIVARTFSKIAALAGMRLGYAIAPKAIIDQMRPWSVGSISAAVKWAGAASIQDAAGQADVKKKIVSERKRTMAALEAMGFACIPSEANFFMVSIKRPVQPVIEAFRQKNVLVGRPFPPMTEHLRVSVGTPEDMNAFLGAFKQIMLPAKSTAAGE